MGAAGCLLRIGAQGPRACRRAYLVVVLEDSLLLHDSPPCCMHFLIPMIGVFEFYYGVSLDLYSAEFGRVCSDISEFCMFCTHLWSDSFNVPTARHMTSEFRYQDKICLI